jgi:predicted nucleic acid-binding protein
MSSPLPRLVVNTSPLIHLAEAGLLALLQQAAASVWVPEPVAREIRAYGPDDPTAIALATHAWLEVKPVDAIAGELLAWNLGAGETSVIALAQSSPGSMAVIDDLAGRRCAEAMGSIAGNRRAGLGGKTSGADCGGAPFVGTAKE